MRHKHELVEKEEKVIKFIELLNFKSNYWKITMLYCVAYRISLCKNVLETGKVI